MLKNITLSAEKSLIEQARRIAEAENSTLNAEFRRWLKLYVQYPHDSHDFTELMTNLSYVKPGKTFAREELNER